MNVLTFLIETLVSIGVLLVGGGRTHFIRVVNQAKELNTMKWSFIYCAAFLLFVSCEKEPEKPLPDFLIERFAPGEPCDKLNYIVLNFPDSTIFYTDLMDNVRIGDRFDSKVIGALLVDDLGDEDPTNNRRIGISFYDDTDIKEKYDYIEIGSYKFWDFFKNRDIGVNVSLSFGNEYGFISYAESSHFYVLNKEGDNFQMKLCGTFDVILDNSLPNNPFSPTRVTGEYSLTFTDYFF